MKNILIKSKDVVDDVIVKSKMIINRKVIRCGFVVDGVFIEKDCCCGNIKRIRVLRNVK